MKERTVGDVFDEFTEEQKNVVYYMIGQALEEAGVTDVEEDGRNRKHHRRRRRHMPRLGGGIFRRR